MTQSVDVPRKPIPQPDDPSRPFFDGAQRGELMIQRCTACEASLAPGSRACTECLHEALAWVPASGRATLFTYAVMHQKYHPGFYDDLPYNIAVVELDEGPRLNTNIIGIANEELRVGMPLQVTFEDVGEGVRLPKFTPV
ncbi:MAG: Zn-ribbon domain-containing OB-fold protein [Dehalococcoidia bacterium]